MSTTSCDKERIRDCLRKCWEQAKSPDEIVHQAWWHLYQCLLNASEAHLTTLTERLCDAIEAE
jgi:hypothetical protein